MFLRANIRRFFLLSTLALLACVPTVLPESESLSEHHSDPTLVVASFNVSMEATNYLGRDAEDLSSEELVRRLADGGDPQIKNIAEIIQRTRPDIILLNEFDYIADPSRGVQAFIKNYLNVSQNSVEAIDYPYYYIDTVNTGEPSPFDLDKDGVASGTKNDAWGFGFFPGHYGMVLLSRYPIEKEAVRTFQHFRWQDMPGALVPGTEKDGNWYSDEAWAEFRLSSKSHWDIPIKVDGKIIHALASHPTPPVFDGPEDRNGMRNHDEIRFWHDYVEGRDYFYDDKGQPGGLAEGSRFVVLGDLNSSVDEGDSRREALRGLLNSNKVDDSVKPQSQGGLEHKPDSPYAAYHSVYWGMLADYVLPSKGNTQTLESGIFWPARNDELYRLVESRAASSDHRLVWLKIRLKD